MHGTLRRFDLAITRKYKHDQKVLNAFCNLVTSSPEMWHMASVHFIELRGKLTPQTGHGNEIEERSYSGHNHSGTGCTMNFLVSNTSKRIGQLSLELGNYGPAKRIRDELIRLVPCSANWKVCPHIRSLSLVCVQ